MPLKVALLGTPYIAFAILVPLLELTDASPALAVAVLALVAVVCGAAIGAFWPEPSEAPTWVERIRGSSSQS
jgi:hypothetical protein